MIPKILVAAAATILWCMLVDMLNGERWMKFTGAVCIGIIAGVVL